MLHRLLNVDEAWASILKDDFSGLGSGMLLFLAHLPAP